MDEFGINIETANGTALPYLGYIETEIGIENSLETIQALLLVVQTTEYHKKSPSFARNQHDQRS